MPKHNFTQKELALNNIASLIEAIDNNSFQFQYLNDKTDIDSINNARKNFYDILTKNNYYLTSSYKLKKLTN